RTRASHATHRAYPANDTNTTKSPMKRNAIQTITHRWCCATPAPSCCPQPASNDRREQLTGWACGEKLQPANRHGLEGLHDVAAVGHDPAETSHRHAVESAFDLAESRGAVVAEVGPPPDQRPLREEQVRPGEDREAVPAQRMEPGRAERDEHATARLEHRAHE